MNRQIFGPSHSDSLDVFFKPLQEDVIDRVNISTRACIINNEFYLRWQYRIVIPFSEDFNYLWKKNIVSRIGKCMLSHRNAGSCEKCKRPIQCHSCLTEFKMSIHNLELIGHVLELTAWKNFGSGRSPKDPKWADHVWETAKNRHYSGLGVPFEPSQGIIRSAFESHQSLETTCHFQSSPPQSNTPVVESHQTMTNAPHNLPENVQSMVGSYKSMMNPPKPPHRSFCHFVANFAALIAREIARPGQEVVGSSDVSMNRAQLIQAWIGGSRGRYKHRSEEPEEIGEAGHLGCL